MAMELGLLELQNDSEFVFGKFMFRWFHNVPYMFYDMFDLVKIFIVMIRDKRSSVYSHTSEQGKNRIPFKGPVILNQISTNWFSFLWSCIL